MGWLTDAHERSFAYLRLSITDACNFRCRYCLPNGYHPEESEAFLSVAEIRRLVGAFATLGFWKVRITGGEPTVRRDFLEVARAVTEVPGIRRVALSTNGARLAALVPSLAALGIRHVNVSVDTLDRARFLELTGRDALADVLCGIETALARGIRVKVNAVLMKDVNDASLGAFRDWVKDRPVAVRFIELMETGDNRDVFRDHHVSSTSLQRDLLARGWKRRAREEGDGPAVEFSHPSYQGTIGIIAPYAPEFCSTCNRLRVSCRGALRLCLFGDGGFDLRPHLVSDEAAARLPDVVRALLVDKKASHALKEGSYGTTKHFASIGG